MEKTFVYWDNSNVFIGAQEVASEREWVEKNGTFVALDDHYDSVTFLAPPSAGQPIAAPRHATPVTLDDRSR